MGTCLCEHILMNAYTDACLQNFQGSVLTVRPCSTQELAGTFGLGSPDQVPSQGFQNPSSLGEKPGPFPSAATRYCDLSQHSQTLDLACVTASSIVDKGTILRRTYRNIITHKTKGPRALSPCGRMQASRKSPQENRKAPLDRS